MEFYRLAHNVPFRFITGNPGGGTYIKIGRRQYQLLDRQGNKVPGMTYRVQGAHVMVMRSEEVTCANA